MQIQSSGYDCTKISYGTVCSIIASPTTYLVGAGRAGTQAAKGGGSLVCIIPQSIIVVCRMGLQSPYIQAQPSIVFHFRRYGMGMHYICLCSIIDIPSAFLRYNPPTFFPGAEI